MKDIMFIKRKRCGVGKYSRINCLYVYDNKFQTNSNEVYAIARMTDDVFKRYVESYDSITVISRMEYVKNIDSFSRVTLENINFKPIKGLAFSRAFSLYLPYNIGLAIKEIKKADFIVVRLPSFLGIFVLFLNLAFKKKYFLEVAGDAKEALLTSKLMPNIGFKTFIHLFFKLNQYFIKHADGVIYVTQSVLQQKYPTKGFTSYASNVDLDIADRSISLKNYELNNNKIKVGLIGEYNNHYKGISEAINAVKILADQNYDISLHVIGSGSLLQHYKNLAKDLRVDNLVHFGGRLKGNEEIITWLESLDLYIQPSYTEGLPRALIEAMSVGLPAVATDVGGIPELISKKNLVPAHDYRALAEKMKKFIHSKELRFENGKLNYQKSKDYDQETLNKRRSEFWDRCRELVKKQ